MANTAHHSQHPKGKWLGRPHLGTRHPVTVRPLARLDCSAQPATTAPTVAASTAEATLADEQSTHRDSNRTHHRPLRTTPRTSHPIIDITDHHGDRHAPLAPPLLAAHPPPPRGNIPPRRLPLLNLLPGLPQLVRLLRGDRSPPHRPANR